jgi:hypothetical protein
MGFVTPFMNLWGLCFAWQREGRPWPTVHMNCHELYFGLGRIKKEEKYCQLINGFINVVYKYLMTCFLCTNLLSRELMQS